MDVVIYVNGTQSQTQPLTQVKFVCKSNGVLEVYDNNVLQETISWAFMDNETKFKMYNGTDEEVYNIETLTDVKFLFSRTLVDGDITYKLVYNFIH